MEARKYVELALEFQIAMIDAELAALKSNWSVASLAQSYTEGQALEALIGFYDKALDGLHAARRQALSDHRYGERKIQHLYL